MSNEEIQNRLNRKKLIIRSIILVAYLSILLYFYFLLLEFGINPLIITLLVAFVFLTTIGPFLRRNKRSLYSRMFPDRRRKIKINNQKAQISSKRKKGLQQSQTKIFKPVNLDFKYRKSIIKKCENCGNIVPNFVDICPFCKNQIIY